MCKGATDLFYPEKQPYRAEMAYIRENYCDRCPVRSECAMSAYENHEIQGIWAGQYLGTGLSSTKRQKRASQRTTLWLVATEASEVG